MENKLNDTLQRIAEQLDSSNPRPTLLRNMPFRTTPAEDSDPFDLRAHLEEVPETHEGPSSEWPGSPNYAGGISTREPEPVPEIPYIPKNDDVPRAGELSSKVFNDLTMRIITELQETVASQINDAVNRREHAVAQMDALKAEISKVFMEYEQQAKKHQSKVNTLAEAVRKKVEGDTQEMISLSKRLRDFADTVNHAHEKFFKE